MSNDYLDYLDEDDGESKEAFYYSDGFQRGDVMIDIINDVDVECDF